MAKKPRGCRKQRYPTVQAAQIARSKWLARRSAQGFPIVTQMNVYHCECGGIHLGRDRFSINWDLIHRLTHPKP